MEEYIIISMGNSIFATMLLFFREKKKFYISGFGVAIILCDLLL